MSVSKSASKWMPFHEDVRYMNPGNPFNIPMMDEHLISADRRKKGEDVQLVSFGDMAEKWEGFKVFLLPIREGG